MNAQSPIVPESLSEAMALAFGEIEAATKDSANPAFKAGGKVSKYADLTAVIAALKPALIRHSLFFTQRPEPSENGVTITTFLHHASGEEINLGTLFVPANKQDAQGFGSALTYARRYALVTAFGVPVEDDDGNAAARGQSQKGEVSPPAADAPKITDDQVALLQTMIPAAKLTPGQFNQTMNIAKTEDLPASRFDEAVERLNERLAFLAKKETDARAKEPANA